MTLQACSAPKGSLKQAADARDERFRFRKNFQLPSGLGIRVTAKFLAGRIERSSVSVLTTENLIEILRSDVSAESLQTALQSTHICHVSFT